MAGKERIMINKALLESLAVNEISFKAALEIFYQRCELISKYVWKACGITSSLGSFSTGGEDTIHRQRSICGSINPKIIYDQSYFDYDITLNTQGLFFPRLNWKMEEVKANHTPLKASCYTWGIMIGKYRNQLVFVQIEVSRFTEDMSWGYPEEIHIGRDILIEEMCKQGNLAHPLVLLKQLDEMILAHLYETEENYIKNFREIVKTREIIETENAILSSIKANKD